MAGADQAGRSGGGCGWSGRRAAYFVLVGYACVLFNFTGVNILFSGLHSYSGVQNAPNAK